MKELTRFTLEGWTLADLRRWCWGALGNLHMAQFPTGDERRFRNGMIKKLTWGYSPEWSEEYEKESGRLALHGYLVEVSNGRVPGHQDTEDALAAFDVTAVPAGINVVAVLINEDPVVELCLWKLLNSLDAAKSEARVFAQVKNRGGRPLGTIQKGNAERNANIRAHYATGQYSQLQLGRSYGLAKGTIKKIVKGITKKGGTIT